MVKQPQVDPADWVTIWQSELAALAVDRECHERIAAVSYAWASLGDTATGRASPDAAPGAAAAGPAPDLGRELDELRRRVAKLERTAGSAA